MSDLSVALIPSSGGNFGLSIQGAFDTPPSQENQVDLAGLILKDAATGRLGLSLQGDIPVPKATSTGVGGIKLTGQLGGTAASPTVTGITETGGPTALAIAGITDGQFLKRSGATVTSALPGKADLPATIAYEDESNTYTGTNTQNFSASGQTVIIPLKADPGGPTPGEIWVNGRLMKFRDNTGGPATRVIEDQGNKGVASGYPSLDGSTKVIENPASASTTAAANAIPLADANKRINWSGGAFVMPAGATASRPASPATGDLFFDTTLGETVVYDGTRWRSLQSHPLRFGVKAASGTSAVLFGHDGAGVGTNEPNVPVTARQAGIILGVRWNLLGGTGGKTWTLRMRLNGSGADAWASTGQSSTTAWQTFTETMTTALAAGDRVQVLVNQGGVGETVNASAEFDFYYT